MAGMRFKVRVTLLLGLAYMIGCLLLGRSILFQAIKPETYFQQGLAQVKGFTSAHVYRKFLAVNESSLLNRSDRRMDIKFVNRSWSAASLSNGTSVMVPLYKKWASSFQPYCDGRFAVYNNLFVELHEVLINRSCAYAKAQGGEDPLHVVNRPAEEEDYTLFKGIFTIQCQQSAPKFSFKKDSYYLSKWLSSSVFAPVYPSLGGQTLFRFSEFTIALSRIEFANVYWTVIDLYNVFLTMNFFKMSPRETHVLLVDAKPRSHLDPLWGNLFASVTQLSGLPLVSQYDTLVWNFFRSQSPILVQQSSIPMVLQFRKFLLNGHGLETAHFRNCSGQDLNVVYIWRRNYVAHPRNPSGIVSRKIKNEDELINATQTAFPHFHVTGVQLDKLPMKEQLKLISSADILIGMHGAAFGFAFALPPGSGMVEMFPLDSSANWHMEYIAKWSGAFYMQYKNKKKRNEDFKGKYTYIPPQDAVSLIYKMALKVCPGMPLPKVMPSVNKSSEVLPIRNNQLHKHLHVMKDAPLVNFKSANQTKRDDHKKVQTPSHAPSFQIKTGPGPSKSHL